MKPTRGRVFRFGANVTTDDILPGRYLDRAFEEVGPFAMAGIDPTFATRVRPGDVIVAGENFGMGSGRESAPLALKRSGLAAVIAPSFARLFYRNAINLGLPAILLPASEDLREGDEVEIDLESRTVRRHADGRVWPIENIVGTSRAILEAGGIVPFTRNRLALTPGRPR